jgi:NAD+ kinase
LLPVSLVPPLLSLGLLLPAFGELGAWASAHGVMVGQVPVPGQRRRVADRVAAGACDLLLAFGGDGTVLSALHAGAPTSRPVLAVACGSLGVLTSVSVERIAWALDEVAAGRWTPVAIAGLDVTWGEARTAVAINDVAVIRGGAGQIMVSVALDDVLYAELSGDGVVVATALGSSAYTMAAGGPLLAPGADGMVDGHLLTIQHREDYATFVTLDADEPRLTRLRRRGLVRDSPRVVVRGGRSGSEADRPRDARAR